MPLTKVTSPVLDDNIDVNTINGYKLSLFAEPMSIPVAGKSGQLDSSWGTGGGSSGSGSGDMSRAVYDTNADGKVDHAEDADKVVGNGNNQFLYSDKGGFQSWTPIDDVVLSLDRYDPNKTGKVNSAITADKISGTAPANRIWGTDDSGNQDWKMIGNGDMAADVYDTNADGKVNSADEADRIYAPNGAKNKILGISEDGTQEWVDISPSSIMTMEMYDRSKTGIKVDYSTKADRLATEDGASPLTIYAKNSKGLTGWYDIFNLYSNIMDKLEYAYRENNEFKEGIINHSHISDIALTINGQDDAQPNSIFGLNNDGLAGWFTLDNFTGIMTKDIYTVPEEPLKIKNAKNADTIEWFDKTISENPMTPAIFGLIKNETSETIEPAFVNIENMLSHLSCIKASWCGGVFQVDGDNSLGIFSSLYSNETAENLQSYIYTKNERKEEIVDTFKTYLEIMNIDIENYITFTKDCYVRITFYTLSDSSTATLLLNDSEQLSPTTNYFQSIPLKMVVNDKISLNILGDASYSFYVEFC